MKRIIFTITVLLSLNTFAQNVGINSTGALPVSSAALDVDIANKGILIPRVALTTTTAFAPVTGTPTTSLLVYNTNTAGVSPANVVPGYYYWDGSKWVKFVMAGETASGSLINALSAVGTSAVNINAGVTSDLPGASITFTVTQNVRVVITTSAIGLPAAANAPIQGTIDLLQNGAKIASQYYSGADGNSSLVKLGNYSTISRVVSLSAGTYTFKLQAKSWFNTTIFNLDPVTAGYGGATASDANSMKANISIQIYTL